MTKKLLIFPLILLIPVLVSYTNFKIKNTSTSLPVAIPTATPTPTQTPTPIPSPTLTPTPTPLSFSDLNKLYGPCTTLPILTYHHVENPQLAKENKRSNLNVSPETFINHIAYIQAKGYTTLFTNSLSAFFNSNSPIPTKSIMLTFDDGYSDFYTNVFPLLKSNNIKAVLFLPTGLVDNPDYLTWSQITEIQSSGLVEIANHTWSHRSAKSVPTAVRDEITIADTQLTSKNLNQFKSFAYPFGETSATAISLLTELNYNLAFTTRPGRTMCAKQKYTLPRIHIGNQPLNKYSL